MGILDVARYLLPKDLLQILVLKLLHVVKVQTQFSLGWQFDRVSRAIMGKLTKFKLLMKFLISFF